MVSLFVSSFRRDGSPSCGQEADGFLAFESELTDGADMRVGGLGGEFGSRRGDRFRISGDEASLGAFGDGESFGVEASEGTLDGIGVHSCVDGESTSCATVA